MKRFYRKRERPEFEQKLIDVARVVRIVAGGRRFRFRATVVIGNRKGKVGVGVGKGADVTSAVNKAVTLAKKRLITVPIVNSTIPHEVRVKFRAARVYLKPAPVGAGIIAGGPVRAVVEFAGIKNILSKIYGSSNKTNNVYATLAALKNLRTSEARRLERGKKITPVKPVEQKAEKKPAVKK